MLTGRILNVGAAVIKRNEKNKCTVSLYMNYLIFLCVLCAENI